MDVRKVNDIVKRMREPLYGHELSDLEAQAIAAGIAQEIFVRMRYKDPKTAYKTRDIRHNDPPRVLGKWDDNVSPD